VKIEIEFDEKAAREAIKKWRSTAPGYPNILYVPAKLEFMGCELRIGGEGEYWCLQQVSMFADGSRVSKIQREN